MAQDRSFKLIGNFEDNISKKIEAINSSLEGMRRTMLSFSTKRTGFRSVSDSIGKVVGAYKRLSEEQRVLRSEISQTNNSVGQQMTLLNSLSRSVGRTSRAFKHLPADQRALRTEINSTNSAMRRHFIVLDTLNEKIGRSVGAHKRLSSEQRNLQGRIDQSNKSTRQHSVLLNRISRSMNSYSESAGKLSTQNIAQRWTHANEAAQRYSNTLRSMPRGRFPLPGAAAPPRGGRGFGGGAAPIGEGRIRERSVVGDVVRGGLITNAIIAGFQYGTSVFQQGFAKVLGMFAERTKDQLEDIASAGGIFSAAKFGGAKGLPETFQGALEMQDKINKSMASIASALPGTTQDYVMNARRMTDTLAQVMSKDMKGFEELARKLSGNISIKGEKAFEVVNTEIAKATTLLEKLNPTRTVVPMTQIVEDMMKSEKVTIGGLRRYVSFRRATTLEAALNRNMKELNAAGAGTAARLGMIRKVLIEAVPPELITAMTTSVSGIMEGFMSAIKDPDVGIFGLSRALNITVTKFNKETGKPMLDKLGRQMKETTTLFKIFSDVFGNIGNIVNAVILPGISAIYNPFDIIAKSLTGLRDISFDLFKRQQSYTTYFSNMAEKYGMSVGDFKAGEKGGVGVLLDILSTYDMVSRQEVSEIVSKMEKKTSDEKIAFDMSQIYKTLIPRVIDSPFFTRIGEVLGTVLAKVLISIADTIGGLLGRTMPKANAFADAFKEGGGLTALNRIIIYIAEIIGKVILEIAKIWGSALIDAVKGGNFAAAALLAAPGLMIPGVTDLIGKGVKQSRKGIPVFPRPEGEGAGAGATKKPTYAPEYAPKRTEIFEEIRDPAFRAQPGKRIVNPLFPNVALGTTPAVDGVTIPGPAPKVVRTPRPPKLGLLGRAKLAARAVKSRAMGNLAALAMNDTIGPAVTKMGVKIGSSLSSLKAIPSRLKTSIIGGFRALTSGPGLGELKTPGTLFKSSGALGPLSIITSIITAITSLLSGDSLATALGKGAGPMLGSAIGFAIFGPIGAMIGGWLGSLDSVTQPLADTFGSLWKTVSTTGELLMQIGKDINGFINKTFPQLGGQFDILRLVIVQLLAPFKLLEIAINGLYDLYLSVKSWVPSWLGGGLSKDERKRLDEKRTARSTAEFTAMQREAFGKSYAQQLKEENERFQKAKMAGDKGTMEESTRMIRALKGLMGGRSESVKQEVSRTVTSSPELTAIGKSLGGGAGIRTYAQQQLSLGQISKQQSQQYENLGVSLTDYNLATAKVQEAQSKYDKAVREGGGYQNKYGEMLEAAKKNQQATLDKLNKNWQAMDSKARSNILNSSRNLGRAIATSATMVGNASGVTGATYYSPYASYTAKGYLGDAIASEMRFKPSGSHLLVANSSETVIPAKGGFGMNNFVQNLSTISRNTYASGMAVMGLKSLMSKMLSLTMRTPAYGNWDARMAPSYTSMYARSSSAGGYEGSMTVNAPITINQQPGQDPKQLASMVATELYRAIDTLRNH